MKLDFVLHSNIGEDVFYLLFEFGKRTIIRGPEPFIFGFASEGFGQIEMRRILGQKENILILLRPFSTAYRNFSD